jgi:UDP-N-acetylmuramoylalanine--D-glutamate ligase
MNLEGTTAVVGLGLSGRAAASLAVRRGAEHVVALDLRTQVPPLPGVELELGPHRRETLLNATRIVVSPGVPATQPDVAAAHAAGVPIYGELAFADAFLGLPCAAITGTNGKSTVTWFAGQLLEASGRKPFVGGNLGNPLCNAVDGDFDCLVVEVSSYQLEWPGAFSPQIGVILNLTPDHLKRHGDMEGYAAAKSRLFERMEETDLAVIPSADDRLRRHAGTTGQRCWIGAHPGVTREGDVIDIRWPGGRVHFDLSGFPIPGAHNKDNAATAALVALTLGASTQAVGEALPTLRALEHRMEVVMVRDDVQWINDSKATNVDALRVGLSGLDRPAVVLIGGKSKGPGFDKLATLLTAQRSVITFGGDGDTIADELESAGVCPIRVATLDDAVRCAAQQARSGDLVLLSPGCASFDAFDNFEHRGRVFRDLVGRHA